MASFDSIRVQQIRRIIGDGIPKEYDRRKKFYHDDHWQKGKGFLDVLPVTERFAEYSLTIRKGLSAIFTWENFIREIIERRTDAILAQMPRINFPESISEQDRDALVEWIDYSGLLRELSMLSNMTSLYQKSYLRLWIPPVFVSKEGRVTVKGFEDALRKIKVSYADPEDAAFYYDSYSASNVGVVLMDDFHDDAFYLSKKPPIGSRGEVHFVDGDETVLMIVGDRNDDVLGMVRLPLGGEMLMYEAKHDEYVTASIMNNQMAINTTATMLMYANRESNFHQRVFLNTMPPGEFVRDSQTGEEKFVPDTTRRRGPDLDLFTAPYTIENDDGTTSTVKSDAKVFPAGDARRHLDTMQEFRQAIYRQGRQLHVEISKDSSSTGEARLQAAADHEQDVKEYKRPVVEKPCAWALRTAYRLAKHFAGEDIADVGNLTVQAVIDLGPIAAARKETTVREVQERIKSRRTAMEENGIVDTDAEFSRLEEETKSDVRLAHLLADIIKRLSDAGLNAEQINDILPFGKVTGDIEKPEPQSSGRPPGEPTAEPINSPNDNGQAG